jgi:hypothetical protein
MTRVNLTYHRPMLRPSTFAATVVIALLSSWNEPARADIPPPCGAGDAIICAATDVGKPCQGAGKCFEVSCQSGGAPSKVYNCIACPTVVPALSGTCTTINMGTRCGDADGGTGTCGVVTPGCDTTAGKFVCLIPAPAQPTGPPENTGTSGAGGGTAGTSASAGSSGAAGANSSGGCDVMPRPPKPGTLAIVLIVFGGVFLIVDRLRRRKR